MSSFAEFENVSLSAMFKFVFPLLILMSGMDLSWTQVILSSEKLNDGFWNKHPGGNIFLVCSRCRPVVDYSPAGLPCEADPEGFHHLWGKPQDRVLQSRLAPELEGGIGRPLVPGSPQPLCQVETPSQWGALGHPEHLEIGGAKEQMRLGRPWPRGSRVLQ